MSEREFLDRVIGDCQQAHEAAVAELTSSVTRFRNAFERRDDDRVVLFLAYDVADALRALRNVRAALERLERERAAAGAARACSDGLRDQAALQ